MWATGCGISLDRLANPGLAVQLSSTDGGALVSLWGDPGACQAIAPVTGTLNGVALEQTRAGGQELLGPPGCHAKELSVPAGRTPDLSGDIRVEVKQGATVFALESQVPCEKRTVTMVSPADGVLRPGTPVVLSRSHPLDPLTATELNVSLPMSTGIRVAVEAVGSELHLTMPADLTDIGPGRISFRSTDFSAAAQCSGVETCVVRCVEATPDAIAITFSR